MPTAGRRQPAGDKGRVPSDAQRPGSTVRHREGSGKPREREGRRAEAEARQRKSREIAPLRGRLKELEAEIAKIEGRVRELTDQMANPDLYRDGDRAREVARERKVLEEQAASLYSKWEELALRLESATAGDTQ
jgi:ATP-binding cassette subfamily F protein 3